MVVLRECVSVILNLLWDDLGSFNSGLVPDEYLSDYFN